MQNEAHTLCRPTHLQKKTILNEYNRWEFISTRSYVSFFLLQLSVALSVPGSLWVFSFDAPNLKSS